MKRVVKERGNVQIECDDRNSRLDAIVSSPMTPRNALPLYIMGCACGHDHFTCLLYEEETCREYSIGPDIPYHRVLMVTHCESTIFSKWFLLISTSVVSVA